MFKIFTKSSDKNIPSFKQYFPTIADMDNDQLSFYNYWKKNLQKGNYIDLRENVSYTFVYLYEILSNKVDKERLSDLNLFLEKYKGNDVILRYCRDWISDTHVCLGDIREALNWYEEISLDSRASFFTDRLLSLKHSLNQDISGRDILTLLGPQVTKFVKDNLEEIQNYLDAYIVAVRKYENKNFLKDWVAQIDNKESEYPVYIGTPCSSSSDNVDYYDFSRQDFIVAFIKQLTREAENTYREERSVPRVGEGWVSETNLFYEIKNAFPKNKVVHHASPEWLSRQHLDILIEDIGVAIEYQGLQHDKPVEFFGGEKAFIENQKRDKRKNNLCKRHGVKLIYVREGYSLEEVINSINESIPSN